MSSETAALFQKVGAVLDDRLPTVQQRMVDDAKKNGDNRRALEIQAPFFEEQYKRATALVKPAADAGDPYAALFLAAGSYPWQNRHADAEQCFHYATQAENTLSKQSDDASAASVELILGDLYLSSPGAPIKVPKQSVNDAVKWYEAALAHGMPPADLATFAWTRRSAGLKGV